MFAAKTNYSEYKLLAMSTKCSKFTIKLETSLFAVYGFVYNV